MAVKFRSMKDAISQPKADFAAILLWFRSPRNWPSALCDRLPMAVTPSFQLRITYCLKRWIANFPSLEMTYSMNEIGSKKCSKSCCALEFFMLDFSLFPPCILDLLMTKDYKASKLWFFMLMSFQLLCRGFHRTLLNLGLLWDQITIKNTKTYTIWLETIAKVLNMLLELKGNNYYSKVFKRVNFKVQNNTFWVVIINKIYKPNSPYTRVA